MTINAIDRRSALVLTLFAFLLAFFPWLRTSRGAEVALGGAKQLADGLLQSDILACGFGVHIFAEPEVFVMPVDRAMRRRDLFRVRA